MNHKHNLLTIIGLFFTSLTFGQYLIIEKINIQGNKKTKEATILRDLHFAVGDSIEVGKLGDFVEKNRMQLMNTLLFSTVSINVKNWDTEKNRAEILIEVKENWYIYPYIYVDLADRNFNVWWKDKHRDLKRLNYYTGVRWNNLTGNRDILRAYFQFGYARKVEASYTFPNLGKKNNIGFFSNIYYYKNKEVWYNTANDSIQFYRDEKQYAQQNFRVYGGFTYRYKLRILQYLKFQYNKSHVADVIVSDKNPYYFDQTNTLKYSSLEYKFSYDYRNIRPYPTKGSFFTATLEKQGLFKTDNVNAFYISALYAKFISFSPKMSLEIISKAKTELTAKRQPYYNMRAFGYGKDYLRGYEYYVIDGAKFAYIKTSLRYKIFDNNIKTTDFLTKTKYSVPIKAFICINNDIGKVYNPYTAPSNILPNRLLWGKGIGLDVILYYNLVGQIEYSFNHFGKGGVYLHLKTALE
jgi:outer membrane protein assembly factor BamA